LNPSSDDNEDPEQARVLAKLENIDDDCDRKGISFVRIDDQDEVKEYGIDQLPALVYFENRVPSVYVGEPLQLPPQNAKLSS